jgi:PAS domain S-box-containing protein
MVAGKSDDCFFSIKEAKLNNEQDKKVLQTGKAIKDIEQYIPGSRKKKWGIISKLPITDNDNKTIGILGIILDITEKKEAEKIRTLFEDSLKDSNDVIWMRELDTNKLVYVSKSVTKLTGYTTTHFKNNIDFWMNYCVHPEDRETYRNYRSSGTWPRTLQYRIIDISGKTKWIETILFYKSKKKNIYRAIDRDITGQINSEFIKRNQVKIEIAKKMLQNNLDLSIITDTTGLSSQIIKDIHASNI